MGAVLNWLYTVDGFDLAQVHGAGDHEESRVRWSAGGHLVRGDNTYVELHGGVRMAGANIFANSVKRGRMVRILSLLLDLFFLLFDLCFVIVFS